MRFSVVNAGLRFQNSRVLPFLHRWLPLSLLVIAIGNQCIREYYARGFSPDKADQIAATESFLKGDGLTVNVADPADLSRENLIPLIGRPPGYSFALAPLLSLLDDIWWADLVLQWIFTVLFFLAWYWIMESLGDAIGQRTRSLVWFYWAIVYSPLEILPSGDLLALSCFSAGLAQSVYAVRRKDSAAVLSASASLLFGASAAIRFAYWPLLIVEPLAFAYLAIRFDRRYTQATVVSTMVSAMVLGGLTLFQINWTGSATYLDSYYGNQISRLYWDNLAKMDLFFPTVPLGFNLIWAEAYNALYNAWRIRWAVYWLVQMTAVGIVLIALVSRARSYLARAGNTIHRLPAETSLPGAFFYLAGILTLVLTLGMLLYLSVRYPPSDWRGWVYGQESRYYAPTFGFLVVAVAEVVFASSRRRLTRAGRVFRFVTTGMLLTCILFVPLVQAGAWLAGPGDLGSPAARYGRNGIAVLAAIQDYDSPDLPLVFVNDTSDITLAPLALMWGAKTLEPEAAPVFRTAKSVDLIVGVDRIREPSASSLRHTLSDFAKGRGVLIGQTEQIELYQVSLVSGEVVRLGQLE